MNLTEAAKQAGRHRHGRRVGRGESGGRGKTCGRGHKGCNSRAGGGAPKHREGGQMAIYRRIPKRGFSNAKYATRYSVINVGDLNNLFEDGAQVSIEALCEVGLVRDADRPVKVLGDGELTRKLSVSGHKFSRSASAKITEAGGEVRHL